MTAGTTTSEPSHEGPPDGQFSTRLAPLAGTQFGDGLATALQKIKALLPKRALIHFANLAETIHVKNLARQNYAGADMEIHILNHTLATCCFTSPSETVAYGE